MLPAGSVAMVVSICRTIVSAARYRRRACPAARDNVPSAAARRPRQLRLEPQVYVMAFSL